MRSRRPLDFACSCHAPQRVRRERKGEDRGAQAAQSALLRLGADVQPGKKVKAKVTGTIENKATLRVAEVDVKTKGK